MHVSMMCDSVCYVRVDAAQLPTGLAENLRKLAGPGRPARIKKPPRATRAAAR